MSKSSQEYDPSIREELKNVDWKAVFPRVLKYARSRARMFSSLGNSVEPEDLVNEAVARAYGIGTRGTFRNWDKEKCQEFDVFLIGIIKSITSQQAEHLRKFPSESIFGKNGSTIENNILDLAKADEVRDNNPEKEIIGRENLESLMIELNRISEEDEELGLIIVCAEMGIRKAKDIAEETGIDPKRVYKLQEKLRNRLESFNPRIRK